MLALTLMKSEMDLFELYFIIPPYLGLGVTYHCTTCILRKRGGGGRKMNMMCNKMTHFNRDGS